MPELSIIVPVYNVAGFLDRCIQSILAQTYDAFQLLLVDDASTDDSLDKCFAWAKKDSRIQVIAKAHGGLVDTRKAGLAAATGKYVGFVDPDDWIEADYFEQLMLPVQRDPLIDIVAGRLVHEALDGRIDYVYPVMPARYVTRTEALLALHEQWDNGLCTKLYRRELFSHFEYDANAYVGEDLKANWALFHLAKRIYDIGKGGYHYIYNPSSIMNTFRAEDYLRYMEMLGEMLSSQEVQRNAVLKTGISLHVLRDWQPFAARVFYSEKQEEMAHLKLASFFRRRFEGIFDVLPQSCFFQYWKERFLPDGGKDLFEIYTGIWDALASDARQGRPVYIYGAGTWAKRITAYFGKRNIPFQACLVSGVASDQAPPDGVHPVMSIEDVPSEKLKDAVMYLAMRMAYMEEVYESLLKKGVGKIVML